MVVNAVINTLRPLFQRARRYWWACTGVGLRAVLEYVLRIYGWRWVPRTWLHEKKPVQVWIGMLGRHVWMRRWTSDPHVLMQIFYRREYALPFSLEQVGAVVDLGANVGYSALYLRHLFPDSRILAVEPDQGNFAILLLNAVQTTHPIECIQGAVWDSCGVVGFGDSGFRGGMEWSRQVLVGLAMEVGTVRVNAFSVESLLRTAGIERVDLLKMDIEGAEVRVLRNSTEHWAARVDAMVVEVHDDSAFGSGTAALNEFLQGRQAEVHRAGESVWIKFLGNP